MPLALTSLRKRYRGQAGSTAGLVSLALAACSATPGVRHVSLDEPPTQTEQLSTASRKNLRLPATVGIAYQPAGLRAKAGIPPSVTAGEIDSRPLDEALVAVVERLVAASERPDLTYRVTVLNSSAVNAFALPDAQLYVTRGLITLANDFAELASVLSHEMAHVIARHAEMIRKEQARQAELFGTPQAGAATLERSKLTLASFSRAQEFEADDTGVAIAARAGFDPSGAARMLASMGRNASLAERAADAESLDFLTSHPAIPERVLNAQHRARQYAGASVGERGKSAYLASLDGLIFGDDPIEGYVRGRRFLHPALGATFLAPDGFALDIAAQAVLGRKDGTAQAMRLDIVDIPPEQSPIEYINSGWIENIEDGSVEELAINGFPAATATAKGARWAFRLYVIRFGRRLFRFTFAATSLTADTDRSFRDCVNTFRRLSLFEIRSVKPLRLRIVRVGLDDSAESLASRMVLIDRQVDRFRVLNGLEPNEQPKVGDLVKLIVK